jgi:hypothetical protein
MGRPGREKGGLYGEASGDVSLVDGEAFQRSVAEVDPF